MERIRFTQQATLHICSSLDFGEALENTRLFLAETLPVDGLFLTIFEKEKKALRTIFCSNSASGPRKNVITPLNDQAIREIEEKKNFPDGRTLHMSQPMNSSVGNLAAQTLGYTDQAIIGLRLEVGGQMLGVIIASARPGSDFTDAQIELFSSLYDPFVLALTNALTHEKVVDSYKQLEEDRQSLVNELAVQKEERIIGSSGRLQDVMKLAESVAPLNNTVLLLGETGTGKEVIANAIHNRSPRRNGPFIKVNCGAIPPELIDSELFGHEKGAFTGATNRRPGRFELADGGTLFLDEIGELPPAAQVRLLRVLQTHVIERVGGVREIPVNIRVIAATHRDMQKLIRERRFREDLWFRINVFPIYLPPLRQRLEDIGELAEYFIREKSAEMGFRPPLPITAKALEQLKRYKWPGNVRELENLVERTLIRSRGSLNSDPEVFTACLSAALDPSPQDFAAHGAVPEQNDQAAAASPADDQFQNLDDVTRKHIRDTLQRTGGRINGPAGAAALLGLHPSTLRNKMKKLGIEYGRSRLSADSPSSS